jgi:glycerophosphoryl diester phosphodiesterase
MVTDLGDPKCGNKPAMLLLGHRGASADKPENTLESFTEAIQQGADGVELDAMLCGSGEVVVCHDDTLQRVAGVDWVVGRTPWQTLREADVGSLGGRGPAHVPLLEDVLGTLPKDKLVNVEIKCETRRDGGLTARVAEVISRTASADRVVVSSFNALCLLRLSHRAPRLRRGYLIDPELTYWLHGGLLTWLTSRYSVHPHASACTEARMILWHGAGLRVAAWTVDEVAEARRLQALGVEYVITNRPGALRRELEGTGPSTSSG